MYLDKNLISYDFVFKKIQLKYEIFIILLNKLKMNLKFILLINYFTYIY